MPPIFEPLCSESAASFAAQSVVIGCRGELARARRAVSGEPAAPWVLVGQLQVSRAPGAATGTGHRRRQAAAIVCNGGGSSFAKGVRGTPWTP